MHRFADFSASYWTVSGVSERVAPTKISNPEPIAPTLSEQSACGLGYAEITLVDLKMTV
tara:strand:+ start:501 stop:677 length:177 start_codon:yes stop_codon:yes gene_type:complete